ncbi:MAG: PHP domain-containing protein [Candidatus Moranbacteria bacterium]|nr:PHP domain-containing protein [Candidatus Moranbacteria bacterium]
MKDFHIHSGLIEHTNDDIFSIAQKAKELGFTEITILEHISPFKIKYPANLDPSNTIFADKIPETYSRRTSTVSVLVEQCKKAEAEIGIKINRSLEVDYYKSFENDIKDYEKHGLDYLTLSSHYVEDPKADDENKLIHIGFSKNMNYFLEKYGEEKLFELYFKNLMNGVKSGLFELVAHLDFFGRALENYDHRKVIKYVEPILEQIIKREMFLELNISQEKLQPALEIIEKYKELGGNKLVFGSDSHSLSDLVGSIEKRQKFVELVDVK